MLSFVIIAALIWASGFAITFGVLKYLDQVLDAPLSRGQARLRLFCALVWPVLVAGALLAFIGLASHTAFEGVRRKGARR